MDLRRDTTIEAILDQLIATGATDLGRLFGQLLELALQIERAQFRKASLYERTPKRQGYANGYKPKRIDTPRGRRPYRCPKPFDALVARYRAKHPDFADGLENYIPEGLAVFSLPEVNRAQVKRYREANPTRTQAVYRQGQCLHKHRLTGAPINRRTR